MPTVNLILDAASINRILSRIAHEIAEHNEQRTSVVLVGVQRGGVLLAQRLSRLLEQIWGDTVPVGQLDVSMHRDDLDKRSVPGV
jgi:pyrimidine operon attenuation protein/uracil phosphoribosyltransferase